MRRVLFLSTALVIFFSACVSIREAARPRPDGLAGAISDRALWGFQDGLWWEKGSGTWTQAGTALECTPGDDPNWAWISSPLPYPQEFELTFTVRGEAELVGIGFGPFKDFVAPKPAHPDSLHFRFVLTDGSGRIEVNGAPATSPAGVQTQLAGPESFADGRLQLKVFRQRGPVRFENLFLKDLFLKPDHPPRQPTRLTGTTTGAPNSSPYRSSTTAGGRNVTKSRSPSRRTYSSSQRSVSLSDVRSSSFFPPVRTSTTPSAGTRNLMVTDIE